MKYTTPEGYEFSGKSAGNRRGPFPKDGSTVRIYGSTITQNLYIDFAEIPQPTAASYNVAVTVDGQAQAVTEELLNKLGSKLVNKEDNKEIAPTAVKGNVVSFADFEAESYKLSYVLSDGYEIVKQVNIASDYKEFAASETAEEASLDLHVVENKGDNNNGSDVDANKSDDKKADKPVAAVTEPAKKLAQTGVNPVMAATVTVVLAVLGFAARAVEAARKRS